MAPPPTTVAIGTPKINTNLYLVPRINVIKFSQELVHWNKSYRTETLLSTDADDDDADDDDADSVIP